jgi:hypothetical protein
MPRLDFPLLPDGLIVDAVIGVDRPTTEAQLAAGQPLVRPITARGEVDTGTNMTAVSAAILRRLGVPVRFRTTTQTTAGQIAADVF